MTPEKVRVVGANRPMVISAQAETSMGTKKKGPRFREPFYFLVAGAGFEPTTFGL